MNPHPADRPLLLDLFAGRLGWSKAFLARGWKVIAFDLVLPPEVPENVWFVQRDVLDVHSFHFGEGLPCIYQRPDFIVASPPCEEFSKFGLKCFYPDPPYPELGMRLFNHTRALCTASRIPYVMENVRAAQRFIGNAVNHCGPFYLWGTGVPFMLPQGIIKGKRLTGSGYKSQFKVSSDASAAAIAATIPPELANAVVDYAERLLEQKKEMEPKAQESLGDFFYD